MMAKWRSLLCICLVAAAVTPGRAQVGQVGVEGSAQRAAALQVRVGDQVALHFLREPTLNVAVTVTERGEADFPKLGTLRVTALTIQSLQDTLRARYSEYLRSPELEVAVLRRVIVNGEVKLPNVYMVDINSTVRDVLARAGGVTEMGNRNNVVVVRDGRRIPAKGWDVGKEFELVSGDQIVVGRKNWFVVNAIPAISTAVLLGSFALTVATR